MANKILKYHPEEFQIEKEPDISRTIEYKKYQIDKRLEIDLCKDHEDLSFYTAKELADKIKEANADSDKKQFNLVLPTGRTPERMYRYLAKIVKKEKIDLSKIVVVRVEGYLGLKPFHPASFDKAIKKSFFDALGLKATPQNFLTIENLVPKKLLEIPPEATEQNLLIQKERLSKIVLQYDEKIRKMGGIDYAIFGLGADGHIGDVQNLDLQFQKLLKTRKTRIMFSPNRNMPVDFDPYTIQGSFETTRQKYFKGEELPTWFVTLGLDTMVQAKNIRIMASGDNKSWAVKQGIEGGTHGEIIDQKGNSLGNLKRKKEIRAPISILIGVTTFAAGKSKKSVKFIIDKKAASDLSFIKNVES